MSNASRVKPSIVRDDTDPAVSQIYYWPIERLTFYSRNPRKNDGVVDRMCASILEFGFKVPVLARGDGEVVDGHLRLKAARKLNIKEVPVILCDEWSPAQVRAFRLMVNRSVTWADWDDELLSAEIQDLDGTDFDLALTGFDSQELDDLLLPPEGEDVEDELPPVPANPVSRPADLWICGRHRVLCGDSTNASNVSAVLGDRKPQLMVTDPPYGVRYDPEWRKRAGVNNSDRMGKVSNDDRADWREAWALFSGEVAYVWHGALHASVVAESLTACAFQIRSQIIWAKPSLIMGRGSYHWQHEPCWYVVRDKGTGHWMGDRKQSTLWSVANREQDIETIHSTQKPVELMRRPILNHTKRGEWVYDPFLGSGTTLAAAELTERCCVGLELDQTYVDVIVQRWQKLSGGEATLAEDGRTFAEIANQRGQEVK